MKTLVMQRVCRLQDHFQQLREQRDLHRSPGEGELEGWTLHHSICCLLRAAQTVEPWAYYSHLKFCRRVIFL